METTNSTQRHKRERPSKASRQTTHKSLMAESHLEGGMMLISSNAFPKLNHRPAETSRRVNIKITHETPPQLHRAQLQKVTREPEFLD